MSPRRCHAEGSVTIQNDIKTMTKSNAPMTAPTLHAYDTGEELREATPEEHRASIRAARFDGGAGVIVLDDGRRCYVVDGCPDTLPATGPEPVAR